MNEIIMHKTGWTIVGSLAHKVYFKMQSRLEVIAAESKNDMTLNGRFVVIDSLGIVRAAQSEKEGAMEYMGEDRVLLDIEPELAGA